jgi:hypothetical protein
MYVLTENIDKGMGVRSTDDQEPDLTMAAGAGQKVDHMGESPARPGAGRHRARPGAAPVTRPRLTGLTTPPPPGRVPPAAAAGPPPAGQPAPPQNLMRQGPGVPVTPEPARPGLTAEDIWRTGLVAQRAARPRKPRLRRVLGSAVTLALLAVAAVILFLRFHHPAFAVTSAAITSQSRNGCTVDVTGRIATSGGAGNVSYQWVFRPDSRAPQPLSQTVIAGQKDVFVTVAVEGSGAGSASQSVTLQVLGPDKKSATTSVVVRC